MSARIFIDGEAGTTGLQIRHRLERRGEFALLSIDPARRKDPAARAEALNAADVVVLCLPDEAAREAVSLITRSGVRVIDASTAHRVAPGWTYGFAEMDREQRRAIASASRVANPGCFATGAIALLRPMVQAGLLPPEFPVTLSAISGYSGVGRPLIAEYSASSPGSEAAGHGDAFRIYGLPLAHKHLPEIQAYARLTHAPLFLPAVGRFAQGMLVEVPLPLWALPGAVTPRALREALEQAYAGSRFVEVAPARETEALQKARSGAGGYLAALDPESLNGTNRMRLYVFGGGDGGQALLVAILDNLGKGASGAAVQNLNLMLGLDEAAGL